MMVIWQFDYRSTTSATTIKQCKFASGIFGTANAIPNSGMSPEFLQAPLKATLASAMAFISSSDNRSTSYYRLPCWRWELSTVATKIPCSSGCWSNAPAATQQPSFGLRSPIAESSWDDSFSAMLGAERITRVVHWRAGICRQGCTKALMKSHNAGRSLDILIDL